MNLMPCATDCCFTTEPSKPVVALQLGIRPEDIGVTDAGCGKCDGVVQVSEYLGAVFFQYFDCGELGLLIVRSSGAMPNIEGQTIGLSFEKENLQFFGVETVYGLLALSQDFVG